MRASYYLRHRPSPPKSSNDLRPKTKARPSILPIHTGASRRGGHNRRSAPWTAATTTVLITIAACVILVCWIGLKVGRRDSLDRLPALRRVSASDHANFTQFFPCIDDVSTPPFTEIKSILPSARKMGRVPGFGSLPCSPPNKNMCFRGVYDGFDDLVFESHKHEPDVHQIYTKIALVLESLIFHPNDPISPKLITGVEPALLEPAVEKINPIRREKTTTMHSDYFESDTFVYTAILYDNPPKDLIGGETGLVDFKSDKSMEKATFGMKLWEGNPAAPSEEDAFATIINHDNQQVEFTSGLIVEPKLGRLLVFSAGGENFHLPLEVKSGYRPSYIFWFKCKSQVAVADT